eukprot:5392718-Pyramimonas_sp.AAC.1
MEEENGGGWRRTDDDVAGYAARSRVSVWGVVCVCRGAQTIDGDDQRDTGASGTHIMKGLRHHRL